MKKYNFANHLSPAFCLHAKQFALGQDTPSAYLERCLSVIQTREPIVKAWVTLETDHARAQAILSTERWQTGRQLSTIDGMPIGIKDLIATKDMPTQLGCLGLPDKFPRYDSATVWALREAGAIILGKTVTVELGFGEPGPTTNPLSSDHTPGGSSSGSAAAVSAGMVPCAIGTQVGGSIIRPASYCGVYALKPTQGSINRDERQANSMSTYGPLANSLEDMWAVAIEIAKRTGGDPGHSALNGPDLLPDARVPGCIAVLETEGWSMLDERSRIAFESFLSQLKNKKMEVIRRDKVPILEKLEEALVGVRALATRITAWENQWSLRNLLRENRSSLSERSLAHFAMGEKISVRAYQGLLEKRRMISDYFLNLSEYVDILVSPSSAGPAPLNDYYGTNPTGNSVFNTPGSLLGAPCINVPLLTVDGMPMGIQLIGKHGKDKDVAAVAKWLRTHISPVERAAPH